MVDAVTHSNYVQSVYAKDPWQMQRPRSVSTRYGAGTLWTSGDYLYDSSGNLRAAGNDYYVYDLMGRLTQGTSERLSSTIYKQQTQSYDVYGNITYILTTVNSSGWSRPVYVSPTTNRLLYAAYDAAGNQLSWDGVYTYGYDSQNMMISQQGGSRDILYMYTADDERIWTYDLIANRTDYAIRDLDKKVLRVFDENNGTWSWKKDLIYRGATLFASQDYQRTTYQTTDHLGTPRYLVDAYVNQVGRHAYYPFGEESTSDTQNREFIKFTGHERDTSFNGSLSYLDYMHARYYNPVVGRFLSVDPGSDWDPKQPQSWNMYGYVRNNPINASDPDGRAIDFLFDIGSAAYGIYDMWDTVLSGRPVTARQNAAVFADVGAAFTPGVTGAGAFIRIGGKVDDAVDAGRVAKSKTAAEMAADLQKKLGKSSVEFETPKTKGHIDLAGNPHFDKATKQDIPTPHVQTKPKHLSPSGRVNTGSETTRPATKDDIRMARRLEERRKKRDIE